MNTLISQGGRVITKPQMVDRINDIGWQAQQGSVAAIIQLLNEKLAKSGVRTRAIFSDGVLQLLCEAARIEQLEQSALVEQIQQILESIAPRHIRRVNINSRIVREQQLLWLKEIDSDRDNQLLWSQEIALIQPNVIKQLIQDLTEAQAELGKPSFPKPQVSRPLVLINKEKHQSKPKKKILAAVGLCSLLLLSWVVYAQLGNKLKNLIQPETSKSSTTNTNDNKAPIPSRIPNNTFDEQSNDPFATSVRIANLASTSGKTATTSTQWLEIAAKWQRASDLMSTVPQKHSRYQEAKIRTQLYKKYSEAAQKEAYKSKS
ncbi:MAG: hypothetical protein RMZ41_020720 [Nostoc sp. DedVER02]|uniref:hypothetical protein n=1 Tax=unclassified Nostoc TaxID=2593658 RepID=UPI002AD42C87|nr:MULTISPECIES: hypothetical protein [unclassified Nostoc]MDZ7984932.1 hypothetical protein [Nostoc sp. DedVER02]MDZ8111120.1 hypothetical protein [Nostoc sp. DedVER01b]